MKYCAHCGTQLNEEAVYCHACGCKTDNTSTATACKNGNNNNALGTIAKILMVVTDVFLVLGGTMLVLCLTAMFKAGEMDIGFALGVWMVVIYTFATIISLGWCIPMTVHVWKKLHNNETIGTGMKVCVLIFVNLIAGILLLCMTDN